MKMPIIETKNGVSWHKPTDVDQIINENKNHNNLHSNQNHSDNITSNNIKSNYLIKIPNEIRINKIIFGKLKTVMIGTLRKTTLFTKNLKMKTVMLKSIVISHPLTCCQQTTQLISVSIYFRDLKISLQI
jgi:hypothetical protein